MENKKVDFIEFIDGFQKLNRFKDFSIAVTTDLYQEAAKEFECVLMMNPENKKDLMLMSKKLDVRVYILFTGPSLVSGIFPIKTH